MSSFRDMDELLQGFVDGGLPGCGCAIAKNGKTIYEGYFGYADVDSKKPIDAGSVYRQYSLSKVSIYTACMMLYEKGKFLLSDPIYEYFPEYRDMSIYVTDPSGVVSVKPLENPIRVRDAMNMSCGVVTAPRANDPSSEDMKKIMGELNKKEGYGVREYIREMAKLPVYYVPGSHWMYSMSDSLTAGLIETVTGKPLGEALRELLFDPLGMDSTGDLYFGDIEDRMVSLYKRTPENKLERIVHFTGPLGDMDRTFKPGLKNEIGYRRLFSSVPDYIKLTQMLSNGGKYNGTRVMGRKTIDLMRENFLNSDQLKDMSGVYLAGYGYGCGVRTVIDQAAGGHNGSLGAFGWTGAAGTWAEADPSEGVSIVYMHNQMPSMEEYYHLRVRAAAYGCIE